VKSPAKMIKVFTSILFVLAVLVGTMVPALPAVAVSTFNITAAASTGGTISPSGTVSVISGGDQTFNITPDDGVTIADVWVDGISHGSIDSYTFTNVASDHTIAAKFNTPWILQLSGYSNKELTQSEFEAMSVIDPRSYTDGQGTWNGTALYNILGLVDDADPATFNTTLAGYYQVKLTAIDGFSTTFSFTSPLPDAGNYIVADKKNGEIAPVQSGNSNNPGYPLRFTGAASPKKTGGLCKIELLNIPYTITASSDAYGAAVANPVIVASGGNSTVTFAPSTEGFGLKSVTDNGSDVTSQVAFSSNGGGTYTLSNVVANHTIAATFSTLYVTVKAGTQSYAVSNAQFFSMPTWNFTTSLSDIYVWDGVPVHHLVDLVSTVNPENYSIRALSSDPGYISLVGPATNPSIAIDDNHAIILAKTRRCEVTPSKNKDYSIHATLASNGFISTSAFNQNIVTLEVVYTIAASTGSHGAVTAVTPLYTKDGLIAVSYDGSQSFNISPAAGYYIEDVLVDGVSAGIVTSYTFTNVTANHTISAAFTAFPSHTITVTAGENGSITPAGTGGVVTVTEGDDQTFTITPNSGFHISSLTVDSMAQPLAATYNFTDVTADHSIAATFASGTQDWPLQLVGVSTMNVTQADFEAMIAAVVSPEVPSNEYTDSSGNVWKGLSLYRLIGLVDDADPTTFNASQAATYNLTLTSADSITVIDKSLYDSSFAFLNSNDVFLANKVKLSGSDTWIDLPLNKPIANGNLWYPLRVTGSGLTSTFRISALTKIELVFNAVPVTATAGEHGSISPSGDVMVTYGTDKTFTITADNGCHISDVVVDGTSVGAVSEYTFANVTSAHTIQAVFLQNEITVWVSPAAQNVSAGETFNVDIKIETNTEVSGWQLNVNFDPAQLQANSVTEGGFLADYALEHGLYTQPGVAPQIDNDGGHVTNISYALVGSAQTGGASGIGVLCRLSFTASQYADALAHLTISGLVVSDAFGQPLGNIEIVPGAVQINRPDTSLVVNLAAGWNTFSTPISLDPEQNSIGQLFPDAVLVFAYDNVAKAWETPEDDYVLQPLEAVYVYVNNATQVLLHINTDKSAPPAMQLSPGWNLVGLANMQKLKTSLALRSVQEVLNGPTGYVQVVSPGMGYQDYWAYIVDQPISDSTEDGWMKPYLGYWVFMINGGQLAGFTTTPVK
jgi:hypothetical protein